MEGGFPHSRQSGWVNTYEWNRYDLKMLISGRDMPCLCKELCIAEAGYKRYDDAIFVSHQHFLYSEKSSPSHSSSRRDDSSSTYLILLEQDAL